MSGVSVKQEAAGNGTPAALVSDGDLEELGLLDEVSPPQAVDDPDAERKAESSAQQANAEETGQAAADGAVAASSSLSLETESAVKRGVTINDAGEAPWRADGLDRSERARLFVKVVAKAHAANESALVFLGQQAKQDVLDHVKAHSMTERIWDYDLSKLQEQAMQMGADPLR